MRLIDADALNKVLGFADPCANCKHVYGMFLCDDAIWQEVCDAIYEAPTIDAVPARRGEWIRTGRSNIYGGTELECNLCKDRVMVQDVSREHYCRNCGAKMDEEEP